MAGLWDANSEGKWSRSVETIQSTKAWHTKYRNYTVIPVGWSIQLKTRGQDEIQSSIILLNNFHWPFHKRLLNKHFWSIRDFRSRFFSNTELKQILSDSPINLHSTKWEKNSRNHSSVSLKSALIEFKAGAWIWICVGIIQTRKPHIRCVW